MPTPEEQFRAKFNEDPGDPLAVAAICTPLGIRPTGRAIQPRGPDGRSGELGDSAAAAASTAFSSEWRMSAAREGEAEVGSPCSARSRSMQKQRKMASIVMLYTPIRPCATTHAHSAVAIVPGATE